MKKLRLLPVAALLALSLNLQTTRAADTSGNRFPFVLPWDDAAPTITSMANLNPVPAGSNGFVTAHDGHFYDEKDHRIRFIGVNMAAGANFPEKSTAEKVAARLHKLGVNIVRLHHMDADFARPNIFDHAFPDKQHLSADALDRLDYFVFQLKQHGIYVNINLHVAREFTPADGLPEADQLHDFDKAVDFYDPRMIELQKNYARDLLTHRNPYTNTRYVEEPAVAVIEINNENTLLGTAWSDKLDTLPPHYKTELSSLWNLWLKKRYGNTGGLQRAWSAADKPYGPNVLLNPLFEQGAIHWSVEMNAPPAEAKLSLPDDAEPPLGVKGRVARLTITQLGAQNWNLQFHQQGIDLVEGEPYTLSFWARADRMRRMPVNSSIDKDDYHHTGLEATADLTNQWHEFTFPFTAARSLANHNRVVFVLGDARGTIDLAGMTLRPGAEHSIPRDQTIEAGNIPLGHPTDTPAGQDWIAFLIDTERDYMTALHDYIKKDLNSHGNLVGSQVSWGGLGGALRESPFDFADNHAYWQHPTFPHTPWDIKDWSISNTPMTRAENGGTLPDLARYRLANKPYTISEYQHPAPNEYRAEMLPMLAAFAAVQDWDGFYLFDYHSEQNDWERERIANWFSVDSDPAKTAFLPAAALIFERFDMPFAHREARLHVPQNDVPRLMAQNGQDIAPEWQDEGISSLDVLNTRLSLAFDLTAKPSRRPTKEHSASEFINAPTESGPLNWTGQGTDKALFVADAPSSKAIVGYVGGQNARAGGWSVQAKSEGNNFAVLTLSAIDGKPTEQSRSLLLTAVRSVENQGMQWNAARTSVGDQWGHGPTVAEGVSATIALATRATKAAVYALDPTGKRNNQIPCSIENGLLTFAIGPEHKTLWYEIHI